MRLVEASGSARLSGLLLGLDRAESLASLVCGPESAARVSRKRYRVGVRTPMLLRSVGSVLEGSSLGPFVPRPGSVLRQREGRQVEQLGEGL